MTIEEPIQLTVDVRQARTDLSRLVERVEQGDEIIIARAGRPVARPIPFRARSEPRTPGLWRGQVRLASDFDGLDAEVLAAFER